MRQLTYAVDAGVEVIQIRERDLEAGTLAALVGDGMAIARGTGTRVVVNDRVDVALAGGADGVHLRADSLPVAAVRSLAPRGFLIGRSVHSADEATSLAQGADYIIAGTVWPSASKPESSVLLGPGGLSAIAGAVGVPTLAIGGVTLDRVRDVAAAGAAGVAAIGLFMAEEDGAVVGSCRAEPLAERMGLARVQFDRVRSASLT